MSKHKFPYKWYLKDGYPSKGIKPNNLNVFGTFICGGGSTMGYKLAGFNHLGGVEIDPKVAEVYRTNHHPKYLYIEDIRQFIKRNDLPDELYKLDILDGSPPCSSFSMAGNREKDWGKEKVFREGQALQTLDDLFFDYIALAKKLQPKVVIAENVKGLIQGNAKSYVRKIKTSFEDAGYKVQLFLLNAASMGVPQKRERVFFICQRNDLKLPVLKLEFDEKPILFSELKGDLGKEISEHGMNIWERRILGDRSYSDVLVRDENRESNWNSKFIYKNEVCQTVLSSDGSKLIEFDNPNHIGDAKLKMIGSFPNDYSFVDIKVQYLIGMSVPPVMTAQIAHQIYLQWFKKLEYA